MSKLTMRNRILGLLKEANVDYLPQLQGEATAPDFTFSKRGRRYAVRMADTPPSGVDLIAYNVLQSEGYEVVMVGEDTGGLERVLEVEDGQD